MRVSPFYCDFVCPCPVAISIQVQRGYKFKQRKSMIDVEKKAIKTVEDYRHSIKLLKYHLKKEKKTNEKLVYEAAKSKHRPQAAIGGKNRVYELNETVKIISERLKRMGLMLEDIFRMADSKYEGELNKEQFMRVVSKLKTDLNDSVFMEMFYAIDTSLNGLISEDEFLEFSIAYGGCSDPKQIRKYQSKVKIKLVNLIIKKHGSLDKFLEGLRDPASIDKISSELKSLGLSANQEMIMLKTLDPSHTGSATHKYISSILSEVKAKTQKQQEDEQSIQSINQLCVIFRDSKINPIIVYEEADVDGQDGVTAFQLEQAFKKVLADKANSFQIKKWVGLINTDRDNTVSKNQFLRSIQGFYSIEQISKLSKENEAKHPKPKKQGENSREGVEITLKKLSYALQDRGMKNTEAFNFIDVNGSGDIDDQELFEGLKSLGLDIGLVGNILSLFDRNDSKKIDLEEWLRILGEDEQMSDVPVPDDLDLDNFDDTKTKSKKPVKDLKVDKSKKPQDIKNIENKAPNKNGTKSPQINEKSPSPKNVKIDSSTSKIQKKQTVKQQQQKKNDKQKSSVTKKTSTGVQKKSAAKKQITQQKGKNKPTKSFAQDESINFSRLDSKKSKQNINNEIKDKPSEVKIRKVNSVNENDINDKTNQNQEEAKVDKIEQQIGIAYKKNKAKIIKVFKQQDKKGKGFVKLKEFGTIIRKIQKEIPENMIKELFMKNCTNGNQFKYQQWLEELADLYAQEVQAEQSEIGKQQQHIAQQQEGQKEQIKSEQKVISEEKLNRELINKLIPEIKQQDKNDKRGEGTKQFETLTQLIQKEGKRVEKGYKLFDYISDEEGQLKKIRETLLTKAEQIKRSGKRFEDKDFANNEKSILKDKSKANISNYNLLQWRHYSEIFKKPVMFHGEIEPNDIKQEQLGDCYLLSSLASLAEYRNLIERLFEYFDMDNGYFLVWLCIDGTWRLVELDGYLPVWPHNLTTPAFSHSTDEEIWVSIIQKAYAKCYGDYNKIVGGQPFEAIKDLTGGPGMQYNFDKFKIDDIWQKVCSANEKQYIMTAGTKTQEVQGKVDGHDEDVTNTGIVLGHAYSILDLQEVSGEKILKLRNPWGKFEWKGDDGWGDSGKKWTEEMKKKLNHQINENDGIFWITLEQFYANFISVSINYIRPTFYYRSGTLNAVQQIMVWVPTKDFNQGYLMASHRDHRHDGIPINTPYDGIYNILGFIYSEKEGKVLDRFPEKNFLYERQGFVEYTNLGKYPEDSRAVMLLNLAASTNITVGYYGDKPADFEIERNCLPFIEKIAYFDENSKDAQNFNNIMKRWQSSVQGFMFLCFKNLQSNPITLTVKITELKNLRVLPPFAMENTLKIKPGEIQSIRLKILGAPSSCGYSISMP